MREFLRHVDAGGLHEIHGDKPGDIGDRIGVATEELVVGKVIVKDAQELDGLGLVGLTPFGNLGHFPFLHGRMDVAEGVGHRHQEVKLDASLPHLDLRLAQGTTAEQGRLGVKFLDVTADRDRLCQRGAVVQLQNGKPLQRVAVGYLIRFVAQRTHVDRNEGNLDPLFGQEDPDTARVRRTSAIIELHHGFLPAVIALGTSSSWPRTQTTLRGTGRREGSLNHSKLFSPVVSNALNANDFMAPRMSATADKNIVDRTKPHRNSDVARAVRRTRDRLSQRAGNPDYDREMLSLHARAVLNTALAIPVLVLIIAASGLFAGVGTSILVWALITVTCYAGLALLARRIDQSDPADIDPAPAHRWLLLGHVASGIGWAYFASLECHACQIEQFPVMKGAILLLAMAATAIIASALRGALTATFALPLVVYAGLMARELNPADAIMAALLLIALPFFTFVAGHLHRSAVMLLSFRSEKDALIAELETAKAVSDEARRRAEEANLAKSRFLATMSHELRTPLNAILGFSEVMKNEVLGPMGNDTYRDYAGDINSSGHHLLHLINEILDLSRIEAGRYQLNEEPVYLENVAEECCHLMELKARNKDIRLISEFQTGLPRIYADERSLRQVILNLMSNAIKFAPSGSEVRLRIGWTAGGGQYVSVKDNGPGIPEDELEVVLSAFGQGSIAIKSAEQGTGLGLPIVQGLMKLHGGEFQLHSRLREGTEAIAILPATRVMEELPAWPTDSKLAAGGQR